MLLLDSSELEALGELPRSDAVADTLVPISAVRPGVDLVAFVSHRWWRPAELQPDDAAHSKYGLITRVQSAAAARATAG